MNRLKVFTVILITILFPVSLICQGYSDTARAFVGEKLCSKLRIKLTGQQCNPLAFSATLLLSNPTVFYPETLITSSATISSMNLIRLTDSIYKLAGELSPGTDSLTLELDVCGEALAGFDSTCILKFLKIVVCTDTLPNVTNLIITHNYGYDFYYVRFPIIEQNKPNPAIINNSTKWVYRIDKPSEVRFFLCNTLAKITLIADLGMTAAGWHEFDYVPDGTVAAGAYWMILSVNSGIAKKNFLIVK